LPRRGLLTFNTHVGKEEEGAEPGHLGLDGIARACSASSVVLLGMLRAIHGARVAPEADGEARKLDDPHADL